MPASPISQAHFSIGQLEELRQRLRSSGELVGVAPDVSSETFSGKRRMSTAALRKKRLSRADEGEAIMTLAVDPKGVLRWHPGSAVAAASLGSKRAARRAPAIDSQMIVEQFTFDTVGLSDVYRYLAWIDERLTPKQGLWQLSQGQLVEVNRGRKNWGRVLLIIHGTFSNCQNCVKSLNTVVQGANESFIAWASQRYDAILCFNHGTLSRSPLINALQLESLLPNTGQIDIVCHSRGGLVSRWWYEVACRRPEQRGKVIFVGAPLSGTSLAAPDRVRAAIDYFTNIGQVVDKGLDVASKIVPYLSVAQFLMSLVCSTASIVSKTPVADAVIALVPGLDAQSRVQNNYELNELRNRPAHLSNYYFVTSSFRPKDVGWEFWKYFTEINTRVKSLAADKIFPGPHDMVVDTSSMLDLGEQTGPIPKSHQLNFGMNHRVHHTNYFEFKESIDYMTKVLR